MAYPLAAVLQALQGIYQQDAQSKAAPYQAGAGALQNIVNSYMQNRMAQQQQQNSNQQAFNNFMTDAMKSGKMDVTKTMPVTSDTQVMGRPVGAVSSYGEPLTQEKPASMSIDDIRTLFMTGKVPNGYNFKMRPQADTVGQYLTYDPKTQNIVPTGVSTGRKGNALLPGDKEFKTYDYIYVVKPNGQGKYVNVHTGEETGTIPEGANFKTVSTQDLDYKEASSMAPAMPKLGQARAAARELKDLYYKAYNPLSVQPGDVAGGLMARGKGIIETGKAIAGANPYATTYRNKRDAVMGLFAKGVLAESGVLTDQDIERAKGILAREYATKEEADMAFSELDKILSSAEQRYAELYKKQTGMDYVFPGSDPGNGGNNNPATPSVQPVGLEDGQTKIINGKTFIRRNGKWSDQ
jgi:hypothetical protein